MCLSKQQIIQRADKQKALEMIASANNEFKSLEVYTAWQNGKIEEKNRKAIQNAVTKKKIFSRKIGRVEAEKRYTSIEVILTRSSVLNAHKQSSWYVDT